MARSASSLLKACKATIVAGNTSRLKIVQMGQLPKDFAQWPDGRSAKVRINMQRLPHVQTSVVERGVKDYDFNEESRPVEIVGELHQQSVNEALHALINDFMHSSDLSNTDALNFFKAR